MVGPGESIVYEMGLVSSHCGLTPRIICTDAAWVTGVWKTPAGGASRYTNRWPRPANFMRLLASKIVIRLIEEVTRTWNMVGENVVRENRGVKYWRNKSQWQP